MTITINGKSQQLTSDAILSQIAASFGKKSRGVIAELNGTIIPYEKWAQTTIKEGDALELVTFVGGG